jgi:cytochrome bd-type quinol oxidase subunit 2
MKPIYLASLILLALTLGLALLGMLLARRNKIRVRNAASYGRIATLLVLGAAYGLTQFDWPGVHLRQVDFWSLMVILGIVCYALIWAALAYQLNQGSHEEYGESFMLSMLYTDSEHSNLQQQPEEKPSGRKPG